MKHEAIPQVACAFEEICTGKALSCVMWVSISSFIHQLFSIFYCQTVGISNVFFRVNPFQTQRNAASGMSVARSGWNDG